MATLRDKLSNLPRFLWLILIVYLCLASLYAAVTPIFEKPDEHWHFAFTMYMVEAGQLPVQRLTERAHLAEQEGSQPPLYYGVLAGVLKVTGFTALSEGFTSLTEKNPYYGVRHGAWHDNANQFVHGACERACQETARAVYIGRGLSILSGLVALLAAAVALYLAFPTRPALLLGVVGVMAFNPQFLHISSSVSNDVLTVAMVNLAFALALWWQRKPRHVSRAIAVGIVIGLATLSKPSGLSVVVTMGLWVLTLNTLSWRLRLLQALIVGISFMGVSGWWFGRNLWLYGEATATEIHLAVYGVKAPTLTWDVLLAEWKAVANSFWASFGWGAINPSPQLYLIVQLAILLLLLLFIIELLRHWTTWTSPQQRLIVFALFHLLLVGALLFRWMRLTVAPLGRLLFPALLPIAIVLVMGLLSLIPRRLEQKAITIYLSGWVGIALFLLLTLIRPAYTPAPLLLTLPAEATALEIQFGEQLTLEGYHLPTDDIVPGDFLPITLYWRAKKPIDEQFSIALKLFGRDEQLIAENNSYPDGGREPTKAWTPDSLITDRTILFVSPNTQTPTLARLEIDVFRLDDNLSWLQAFIDGQTVRPLRPIGVVVRDERREGTPKGGIEGSFRPLLEQIVIENEQLEVQVDIIWQVGQSLAGDYQAFFHLSPALELPPIQTDDFPPLGGDFPTSYWQAGDNLHDHAALALPTDIPAGDYLLLIGLYDQATQQRITGENQQNSWILAKLAWDGVKWGLTR